MPGISVVVPVYDVEKVLSRCIDSILSQSFEDFELLLIDDGSPDNSGRICDDYSAKDPRIRVIHKENGGVSSARNVGIEKARGEYLVFVDSDDYVSDAFLSTLMTHNEDLVCQTANVVSEDGAILYTPLHNEIVKSDFEPDSRVLSEWLLDGALNWTHCKRFRSSIIHNYKLAFDTELDFAEDTLFVVDYSKHIQSICIENIANYRYVVYKTRNTLSNDYSEKRIEVLKAANKKICCLVTEIQDDMERLYNKRMAGPYAAMIAHNENQQCVFFRVTCYLDLFKDEDFLRVLNTEKNSYFMPIKLCEAIIQKKKLKTLFEYYRWVLSRIKRKIKGLLKLE